MWANEPVTLVETAWRYSNSLDHVAYSKVERNRERVYKNGHRVVMSFLCRN